MADISDKGTRRLPYPLLNPISTNQDTPDVPIEFVTVDVFPIDPDEPIAIKLELSLNEYVALSNAVDVGRDIAYSEDTTMLWWLWAKVFKGLAETMSCEDVADCIETSEAVQDAIATNENILLQQLMTNANNGINNPSVDAATDTINTLQTQGAIGTEKNTEIKSLPECNLDMLWAGIRDGIVQRLDDNARSVLEFLVAKADVGERATALVGAIPIFGSMAKAVLDQMVQLAPDMLNLFESYSSIGNMDEIACEIFGIVCGDCRYPTYDEIFQYYASAGITGFTDIDDLVIAAATDLLFGSTELAALAFYHTMIAYELLVLYMGSKFYGHSGTSAIITMASLGEDFANDNWELLCDSCNESYQIFTWDYTAQQYNSVRATGFSTNSGTWIAGKGWRVDKTAANAGRLTMAQPFDPSWELRGILVKTSEPRANWTTYTVVGRTIVGSGTTGYNMTLTTPTDPNSRCRTGLLSESGIQEMCVSIIQDPYNVMYLEKIICIFNTDAAPIPTIPTSDPDPCGLS